MHNHYLTIRDYELRSYVNLLVDSEDWTSLGQLLTDVEFLEAVIRGGAYKGNVGIDVLLQKYSLAIQALTKVGELGDKLNLIHGLLARAYSGPKRSSILDDVDHKFWMMPITDSG